MAKPARLRVAVAMATYNGEKFLGDQLESILSQTLLPDEIVISDDHSDDDTVVIAKGYSARAKKLGINFRVVTHAGPRGVASNFTHALKATRSDLVALSDQDDWWLPGKLAALSAHFDSNPSLLMVHSDAALVDEAGAVQGMGVLESLRVTRAETAWLQRGEAIRALVRRNLVTGATSMVRRGLIDLAGEIPQGWLHDEWWALVAASHDGLVLDPAIYTHYRQHDSNEVGAVLSGWQRFRERLHEPQEHFRARHRIRHEGLRHYLQGPLFAGTPRASRLLQGRLRHYAWQASLPSARYERVLPVLAALLRGDYARYRRGAFDALRDMVQPGN